MGMDVRGRHPKNKKGEYFRASITAWPPILELIKKVGADIIDTETIFAMGYNDGAGPKDGATCEELASRLKEYLNRFPVATQITGKSQTGSVEQLRRDLEDLGFRVRGDLKFEADRKLLVEFIDFLENCGGFAVW